MIGRKNKANIEGDAAINPSDVGVIMKMNQLLRQKIKQSSQLLVEKNETISSMSEVHNKRTQRLQQAKEHISKLEEAIAQLRDPSASLLSEKQDTINKLRAQIKRLGKEFQDLRSGSETKISELTEEALELRKRLREASRFEGAAATASSLREQSQKDAVHIAGLEAQLKAFKAAHPDSELLKVVEDEDGNRKSRLKRTYDEACQTRMDAWGMAGPTDP